MKLNTILHGIAAIGCIVGIYNLYNAGWAVSQWPIVALIWIVSSYINVAYSRRQSKLIDQLDKERTELIGANIKLEGKLWESEMKMAKQLDKK